MQKDRMHKKARRHVAHQKTFTVLGEQRLIPHTIVDSQHHEPAGQKVELTLSIGGRSDRIEQNA